MKKNVNPIDYALIADEIRKEVQSEKKAQVKNVIVHKFDSAKMFAEFVEGGKAKESSIIIIQLAACVKSILIGTIRNVEPNAEEQIIGTNRKSDDWGDVRIARFLGNILNQALNCKHGEEMSANFNPIKVVISRDEKTGTIYLETKDGGHREKALLDAYLLSIGKDVKFKKVKNVFNNKFIDLYNRYFVENVELGLLQNIFNNGSIMFNITNELYSVEEDNCAKGYVANDSVHSMYNDKNFYRDIALLCKNYNEKIPFGSGKDPTTSFTANIISALSVAAGIKEDKTKAMSKFCQLFSEAKSNQNNYLMRNIRKFIKIESNKKVFGFAKSFYTNGKERHNVVYKRKFYQTAYNAVMNSNCTGIIEDFQKKFVNMPYGINTPDKFDEFVTIYFYNNESYMGNKATVRECIDAHLLIMEHVFKFLLSDRTQALCILKKKELKSIFEAVDSSQRTNVYIKEDSDVEKLLAVLSDVCQDKILVVNNGGMKNGKQGTKSGRNSNSGRNKKAVSC